MSLYIVCPICNIEFKIKNSEKGKRTYCSKKCMAEGYKTQLKGKNNPNYKRAGYHICETCGKEYHNYNKKSKFCSWKCAGKSPTILKHLKKISKIKRKRINKKEGPKAFKNICAKCKKEFYWGNKRKYCLDCTKYGKHCYRICAVCQKPFHSYNQKKTCSIKCYGKLVSNRQKGNKSHFWQGGKTDKLRRKRNSMEYGNWRTSVFKRDNYTCYMCKQYGEDLTAHHILPVSTHEHLIFDIDNGITLCWGCHQIVNGKEQEYETLFKLVVMCKRFKEVIYANSNLCV